MHDDIYVEGLKNCFEMVALTGARVSDMVFLAWIEIICIIALLANNTGFRTGFSYSDWQNSLHVQSNPESY